MAFKFSSKIVPKNWKMTKVIMVEVKNAAMCNDLGNQQITIFKSCQRFKSTNLKIKHVPNTINLHYEVKIS